MRYVQLMLLLALLGGACAGRIAEAPPDAPPAPPALVEPAGEPEPQPGSRRPILRADLVPGDIDVVDQPPGGSIICSIRGDTEVTLLRSTTFPVANGSEEWCEIDTGAKRGWVPRSMVTNERFVDPSSGVALTSARDANAQPVAAAQSPSGVPAKAHVPFDLQFVDMPTPPASSFASGVAARASDGRAAKLVIFTSQHCPACRKLEPTLGGLGGPLLEVEKIDVDRPGSKGIDWDGPVVRQNGIHSLPDIRLYEGGVQIASGSAALSQARTRSKRR